MKRLVTVVLASAVLALPATATAAHGELSSVLSGQTVGSGVSVVHVEAGFPGIQATYLQGASDTFDWGGRFGFDYGYGPTFTIVPGLRFQGVLRFNFVQQPKFNFGLEFNPGVAMYFFPGFCAFGVCGGG